jgi:hypothetical protein
LTDFPLAVGDGVKRDQSIFCCVALEVSSYVSGFAYLIIVSSSLAKTGAKPLHLHQPTAVRCQLTLQSLERQRYRAQIPSQISPPSLN